MFPEDREKGHFTQGSPAYTMDEIPDIDELLSSLDESTISISILKGVGGHTTRLEPCDEVGS